MKHAAGIVLAAFSLLVGCGDNKVVDIPEADSASNEAYDPFARPPGYLMSEVHPDFQEEGMTKFFVGEWTGGEHSPESFFRYRSDGSCEFQFDGFRYSGLIRYEPCRMTTSFKSDGKEYVVMISPKTKDNEGFERVGGIAEVFIGFDPEPLVRERVLDMHIYKTRGEQDSAHQSTIR